MKRYINTYMDKCLLNTLYKYSYRCLLNAYIDKYSYKCLLNAYIDKYSYKCL